MAQVKNTLTGQVLTIPDDQLASMSSQWQQVAPQQNDQTDGVDQTGWTDAMKAVYSSAKSYIDSQQKSGKIMNPSITIDPGTVQRFLDQAKSELDPYFTSIYQNAQADLNKFSTRLGQDYQTQVSDLGKVYGQNLEATQNNFAQRGLAFSSDRTKAENNLKDAANRSLTGINTQFGRSAEDAASTAAQQYGSRNISFNPTVQTGVGPAQINQPGVYGFTPSTESRVLAVAPPNIVGTVPNQQLYAQRARQNELISNERSLRGFYTM